MRPPRAERDTRDPQVSAPAPHRVAPPAWCRVANHGDDAGEYSTAAGTTKGLASVSTVRRQVEARSE